MSDQRSVMQEYRFLDQKRRAGGLTPEEEGRFAQLRDLVGAEAAPPPRSGFDVNAAAAQLRESLLPAGLRSRPLDSPRPPPPPVAAAPEPEPAWSEAPVEPLAEAAPDALFDPSSMSQEVRPQAWNPEAPGYDPNAPYDEAAWIAAGYDPSATYDWSAVGGEAASQEPPAAESTWDAAAHPVTEPGDPASWGADATTPFQAVPVPAEVAPDAVDLGEPPAAEPALAEAEPPAPMDWSAVQVEGAPGPVSSDASLEAMLQFDPAAASAIEPGAMPEGYDTAPIAAPDRAPAGLEDQMYGGPEGDSIPGGAPLDVGAMGDWQPDAALDQGFELASDGSFGDGLAPAAPAPPDWSAPAAGAEPEGWASAPALDLSTPFQEPPPEPDLSGASEAPVDELPTIDGAELLEEIPPETPADGSLELQAVEPEAIDAAAEPALIELPPQLPPELPSEPPATEPFTPASLDAAAFEPTADVGEAIPHEITDAFPSGPAADAPPPGALFEEPPTDLGAAFAMEPAQAASPPVRIEGTHRVVLHTVDGEVKRGLLVDADLDSPELQLSPQGAGAPEPVATATIKAIFFMLSPGEKSPPPEGHKVRVTFRDGRQVAGFSPDYQEGTIGFFMIPADTRTNTGRIWVYQAAVRQVSVT